MDLKQLRCFIAVAEELHFGRAAERLHMAPPALSRQIRLLENELDVRLFSRTTRIVTMTRAGTVFVDEARDILSRTQRAAHTVQDAARNAGEVLRIGALDTAAAGLLPEVLVRFRRDHPAIEIQLTEATTSRQLQGLVTGRLDIGFLRPPVVEADLEWEFLLQEQLLVAIPSSHPLASQNQISLRSIMKEPLILPAKRTRPCTYNLVMRYFDDFGLLPNVVQEATEKQTIISMVAAGMGIALVPEWVEKLQMAGVVYRPLDYVLADPVPPEALLGVCWRRHQNLEARDRFLAYLRDARAEQGDQTTGIAADNVAQLPVKRHR
jgi:DNA-binding transcriptional LysR family regulator